MSAALVFTYTTPWVGREALAMEAFNEAFLYFGKLAANGECEEPLLYMSTRGQNMIIVHGEHDILWDIVHRDEFRDVYLKAVFASPDLGYELVGVGEVAAEQMTQWAERGVELGLM